MRSQRRNLCATPSPAAARSGEWETGSAVPGMLREGAGGWRASPYPLSGGVSLNGPYPFKCTFFRCQHS